jgi:hypothetical protein
MIVPLLAVALAHSPAAQGRQLTAGERAFLAPLFRDAVDYDAIRIVRGRAFPLQGRRTLVTIREAVFVPDEVYVDDYANSSAARQAVLVHEVAHVWQYVNGIGVIRGAMSALVASGGRYGRAYRYQLLPGRDLTDYGIEQQASILQHYFLARGFAAAAYAQVLRRFLADPRYPRRAAMWRRR